MNHKVCDLTIRYGDALLHLFLSQMGETSVAPVCPIHQHTYYELHIVHRGKRLYRIDRRELLLKERELLIIPPGVDHEPMDRCDPGYHVVTFPFSLERVEDTLSFYSLFAEALSANALIPICTGDALLAELTNLVALPLPLSAGEYCRLLAVGTSFFCELFHTLQCFTAQPAAATLYIPDGLPALLDDLVHRQDLPLRAIAKELNYSERHTARLIKQIYHMTLSELRARSNLSIPHQEEHT